MNDQKSNWVGDGSPLYSQDISGAHQVGDRREQVRFDGEPLRRLPDWGRAVRFDGVQVELFPPVTDEIAFQITDYSLFSPYARASVDISLENGPTRRLSCPAGSVFFAPPETLVRARMNTPVEFLVMAMTPDRIQAAFDRAAQGRPWAPEVLVNFVDPGCAALQLEIRRSLLSDPLIAPAYLSSIVDAALARIGCQFAEIPVGGDAKETLPPGLLRRIVQQIEADLPKRITVEELAETARLSRSHFSRAFQAATGEPPQEFIISRRLCRARDLLAATDRSIAAIAVDTGFSSHAHLTTAFKKRIGVTPARYRQSFGRHAR